MHDESARQCRAVERPRNRPLRSRFLGTILAAAGCSELRSHFSYTVAALGLLILLLSRVYRLRAWILDGALLCARARGAGRRGGACARPHRSGGGLCGCDAW